MSDQKSLTEDISHRMVLGVLPMWVTPSEYIEVIETVTKWSEYNDYLEATARKDVYTTKSTNWSVPHELVEVRSAVDKAGIALMRRLIEEFGPKGYLANRTAVANQAALAEIRKYANDAKEYQLAFLMALAAAIGSPDLDEPLYMKYRQLPFDVRESAYKNGWMTLEMFNRFEVQSAAYEHEITVSDEQKGV